MDGGPTPAGQGISGRRARIAAAVLCVGQLMIVLDGTAVTVALPTIQRTLGFPSASLSWVVDAYLMTFGGFLLVAGRIGDMVGRRRVFLAGLVVFTGASLGCGLARTAVVLVIARFVQGVGAAIDSAMVLGIIGALFVEAPQRARAMSLYALVSSVGGSAGVLVGGLVTGLLGWYWIFFLNGPVGVVTFVLARALLPDDRGAGIGEGVDVGGGVLITAAATLIVYGLVRGPDAGFGSARVYGPILGACVMAAAFVLVERRSRHPLVPGRIIVATNVAAANLVRALSGVGLFGMMFLGVLYLQNVLGYPPFRAGLAFVPLNVAISLTAAGLTRRWMHAVGPGWALLSSLGLLIGGLLWLGRVPLHGDYMLDVFPPELVLGLAAGLLVLPSLTYAMAGLRAEDSGLASGLANAALQFGAALGVALLASVSSAATLRSERRGVAHLAALAGGYHVGYLVAAVSVGLAVVVSVLMLSRSPAPARASTGRVAPATRARWRDR